MILDFNKVKNGVDTLDQMARSTRWPLALFMDLLDIARYKAFVLFLSMHSQYENNARICRENF